MPAKMAPQASQDLDTRFSVFLNPIRDLTKNWEIDIAKYLEDYLIELSEIQITFDGGVTVMNFAEAAMLIQGSATVYSKKVEFLWQMVLQMLELLSSKRSLESAPNQEGGREGGGKSTKQNHALEFCKVTNMVDGKNVDMKEEIEEEEKRSGFKFLPAMPLHLVEKEGEKSMMRVILYLKNMETFGNKDDFRINRSYLTPAGLLCLDLPPELLRQRGERREEPANEAALNDSIAGFFTQPDIGGDLCSPLDLVQEQEGDVEDDGVDHGGGFQDDDMDTDMPLPLIEPAPEPVTEECDPPTDPVQDVEEAQTETIITRNGLRHRGPKEKVAEIKLTDPMQPLDPHVETPAKRPIRAGRIRKPIPCNCHQEVLKKSSRVRSKALKEGEGPSSPPKTSSLLPSSLPVEEFITKDLSSLLTQNITGVKRKGVDPRLVEELVKEEEKKEMMRKRRGKTDLTEEEKKEESEREKGEEAYRAMLDAEDQDQHDDDIPDLDFDQLDTHESPPDLALPSPHCEIATPFGFLSGDSPNPKGGLNDSSLYEPGSEYEALVQKWVSEYITSAQEHIASSELCLRVNRWKKMITPKLVEEEERQEFDIHQYGTKVLSNFSEEGTIVSFHDMVDGKQPNEVSRIFLSCLMLSNTYNVEMRQTREGDFEMDCLELKLLSKARHHTEIEEYAAPSQATKEKNTSSMKKTAPSKRKKAATSNSDESESFSETPCEDDDEDEDRDVIARRDRNGGKKSKHKKKK